MSTAAFLSYTSLQQPCGVSPSYKREIKALAGLASVVGWGVVRIPLQTLEYRPTRGNYSRNFPALAPLEEWQPDHPEGSRGDLWCALSVPTAAPHLILGHAPTGKGVTGTQNLAVLQLLALAPQTKCVSCSCLTSPPPAEVGSKSYASSARTC